MPLPTSSLSTIAKRSSPPHDPQLFPHQQDVIDEMKQHINDPKFHGKYLSLPMGYGKTLITLYAGKHYYNHCLIICSKTLIPNWISEIKKFYGNGIKYKILHKDFMGGSFNKYCPTKDTLFVITTPEMARKSYEDNNIEKTFVVGDEERIYVKSSKTHTQKTNGASCIHGITWDAVFVDEGHNYTNIRAKRTLAIASICAKHRWILTGTVIQDPTFNRILGFYLLVNATYPRDKPSCHNYINCRKISINEHCIIRKTNPIYTDIELKTKIINFNLSDEESVCYTKLKIIIQSIYDQYKLELSRKQRYKDTRAIRKLGGSLLAMITYLRQAMVVPIIPISAMLQRINNDNNANDADDANDDDYIPTDNNADLSGNINNYDNDTDSNGNYDRVTKIIERTFKDSQLEEWINSESAEISTRIHKVIDIVDKHKTDSIIIYSNFVTCLEYTMNIISDKHENIHMHILSCNLSTNRRSAVLDNFRKNKGILFVTYALGAEGLNLQNANVVINLDPFWNKGKESQAIARINRVGQKHSTIYNYILVSNTGMDMAMFTKQDDKLKIIDGLSNGTGIKSKVSSFKIIDLVKILELETVDTVVNSVNTR
jgi:SNF2 family DNA or RNA helicase